MDYENIWTVSCDGLDGKKTGPDHHLNFETGLGAVWAGDRSIKDATRALSATEGIISVEPNRSISREGLFDLMLNPPEALTLTSASGHDFTNDDVRPLSRDDFSDAPIAMSIVREAEFEYLDDGTTETLQYARGCFKASSETALCVLAEEVAPRLF